MILLDYDDVRGCCSCSERWYEPTKFHDSSAYYPFDDHNPPPFEMIEPFCEDVHKHLTGNKDNVAVVHCKAGKGRTGVMICCYMLHSGQFDESWRALQYYGEARTKNAKVWKTLTKTDYKDPQTGQFVDT